MCTIFNNIKINLVLPDNSGAFGRIRVVNGELNEF